MKVRVGFALIGALWVIAVGGRSATAQDRFELLLIEPLPAGAEERIAGQLSDLPWQLGKADGVARSVAGAHAAASRRGARAALWLEIDGGDITLRLYDPRRRRLLERRFATGADAMARSAALEAMALSVRSALRAIGADEEVGEEVGAEGGEGKGAAGAGKGAATGKGTESEPESGTGKGTGKSREPEPEPEPDSESEPESEPEPEPKPESEPEPEPEPEPDSDGDSDSPPVPLALSLAAGWNSAIDGQSAIGQQGPFARIGIVVGRVELSAQLQTALASAVERSGVELGLTRKLALGTVAVDLHRGSHLRVALGALAGVAHVHRETRSFATDLRPPDGGEDNDTLTAAFGLELRAALRLFGGAHGSVEIELAGGALCLPAAPVLRYELADGRRDRALWLFEPFLQLGPRVRLEL